MKSLTHSSEGTEEIEEAEKAEEAIETNDILPKFPKISYLDAVIGREIHNYWGNRVLEHTNSEGEPLALKVSDPEGLDRSQGEMMSYAAEHGVLAPKVFGTYDIVTKRPIARVMVSERVPGIPLVDVWRDMSE
ncbi:hypothetical protein ACHAPX_004833 [Trichoderma viride]|jgi:hypothetical protein